MEYLIDNALSPFIADGLVEAGYYAVHVRDIGLGASKDSVIMEQALLDNMIVVSADTDFGTLLALNDSKKPSALLRLLLNMIDSIKDDIEKGSVVVIEDKRVRIRKLPINKKN